jgi:hypothetical protein
MLRRAFGSFRGPGPVLGFIADAEGLHVRGRSADIAVEYRVPGEHPAETLWLPFQFLADCEAKKDEPVELTAAEKGRVNAQWRDGSVPQIVSYDAESPADAAKFPVPPETLAENPPGLLEAVTAATDTCDPASVRFALGHLQFRGEHGTIVATDGRQLLLQSGFQFPWTGDLLVPRSKVFASAELPHDLPVQVGKTGNWVAIAVGRWTIYLAVNVDGRFPDVSRHIPRTDSAKARCSFSQADADFLAETLPRLPSDDDCNRPVTLDLNGHVAVRAKSSKSTPPTEVVLTGSSFAGEPIRVNTNRDYLARAMRLGLRELSIADDKTAILGFDTNRHYVWMPLDPESAIPPAKDAIRIESPNARTEVPINPIPTKRRLPPMKEPTTNTNGHVLGNGHAKVNGQARQTGTSKASQPEIAALIEQAQKLRTALHDLMYEASNLVKALKAHRRQTRAVQSTLASLRQLKGLGV